MTSHPLIRPADASLPWLQVLRIALLCDEAPEVIVMDLSGMRPPFPLSDPWCRSTHVPGRAMPLRSALPHFLCRKTAMGVSAGEGWGMNVWPAYKYWPPLGWGGMAGNFAHVLQAIRPQKTEQTTARASWVWSHFTVCVGRTAFSEDLPPDGTLTH